MRYGLHKSLRLFCVYFCFDKFFEKRNKKATKTAPELERELGAMRMKTEELGKTEKYRGEDVYTHMVFAERILDLAKRAKIEGSMSGLWNVRDELPEILREKIPENQTSWTAFAQAIKDI